VARALTELCEVSLFKHARSSQLCSNPTFDGWILEADFLYQVRMGETSAGVKLYPQVGGTKKPDIWEVKSRRSFYSPNDIVIQDVTFEYVWFIPQKWNQACYDAVYVTPDFGFWFIQVTRSLTHSLKLKYIVQFLDKFNPEIKVNSVRICFVVPNEKNYRSFTPKLAEGNLGPYQKKLEKTKTGSPYFIFGMNRH